MQMRIAIKIPQESATDRAHAESHVATYSTGMCGHKLDMHGWTQTKTTPRCRPRCTNAEQNCMLKKQSATKLNGIFCYCFFLVGDPVKKRG